MVAFVDVDVVIVDVVVASVVVVVVVVDDVGVVVVVDDIIVVVVVDVFHHVCRFHEESKGSHPKTCWFVVRGFAVLLLLLLSLSLQQ